MKWSHLGEAYEVCDFTTFFRLHRRVTAAGTAAVRDVDASEQWACMVADGDTVFTFAIDSDSPMTVVAPGAVGAALSGWLEALTLKKS
jgi:hypothetical protein